MMRRDPKRWTRMSILNTAHARKFSPDHAIRKCRHEIVTSETAG
jgi:glucan phosphorylase